MRLLYAVLFAVALAALSFPARPQSAFACTCLGLSGKVDVAREHVSSADAVVIGQIEDVNRIDGGGGTATILTERVYKGDVPSRFSVSLHECSGQFAELRDGERWVMTLDDRDDQWHAHDCSAAPATSNAGIAYVAAIPDALDTAAPMWPVIFGLAGVAAAAGLLIVIRRSMNHRRVE